MKLQRRCDFVYLGTNAGNGFTYTSPFVQYIYSLAFLYDYSFFTQALMTCRLSRTYRRKVITLFLVTFLLEFLLVTMCTQRAVNSIHLQGLHKICTSLAWGV